MGTARRATPGRKGRSEAQKTESTALEAKVRTALGVGTDSTRAHMLPTVDKLMPKIETNMMRAFYGAMAL